MRMWLWHRPPTLYKLAGDCGYVLLLLAHVGFCAAVSPVLLLPVLARLKLMCYAYLCSNHIFTCSVNISLVCSKATVPLADRNWRAVEAIPNFYIPRKICKEKRWKGECSAETPLSKIVRGTYRNMQRPFWRTIHKQAIPLLVCVHSTIQF